MAARDAEPGDGHEVEPGRASPAPRPPSVIYTASVLTRGRPDEDAAISDATATQGDRTSSAPADAAHSPGDGGAHATLATVESGEVAQPPRQAAHPDPAPLAHDTAAKTEPGSQAGNAGERPDKTRADRSVTPLGPPPPYCPIVVPPKSAPKRAEIAPAPPAASVNLRVMGALGPPPPYRPIVQPGAEFGRGPAPDLEPWRLVSLTLIHADPPREPEPDEAETARVEADWSLPREPEPEAEIPPPPDATRFETNVEFGPLDLPRVWPAGSNDAPHMLPPAFRRGLPGAGGEGSPVAKMGAQGVLPATLWRGLPTSARAAPPVPASASGKVAGQGGSPHARRRGNTNAAERAIRLVLCAMGIGVTVLVLGAALRIGRDNVMRDFPATVRIYAAFGLAGRARSAIDSSDTDAAAAGCAEASDPARMPASGGRIAGCPRGEPPAPPK